MMCKTNNIELVAGYYEWNLYINDKLVYTFGDGISEWITDDMSIEELRNIVDMFVNAMLEELEVNGNNDIFMIKDNMEIIIDTMLNVWAEYFDIKNLVC